MVVIELNKWFVISDLPVAGVGLVRQEFLVVNHIGVHPKAVLHPELLSPDDREIIATRAKNDPSPKAWFVRRLSEGIGSIAASFYPRSVIVRLGDFKVRLFMRHLQLFFGLLSTSQPILSILSVKRIPLVDWRWTI